MFIFYIPNLIDYLRIYFLFKFLKTNNITFYIISYTLDAFDGIAARIFNQSTNFGYYLDMIIDRVSTVSLIYNCVFPSSNIFSKYNVLFFIIIMIEIISHLIVLIHAHYSTVHQKQIVPKTFFSKHYLENKYIMFISIICFELFFLGILTQNYTITLLSYPGMMFRLLACIERFIYSFIKLYK